MEADLEIGDVSVYPGSRVNVQWRGAWYEGTVVKLGPQRNLCRIRDLVTKRYLLMDVDPRSLRPKAKPGQTRTALKLTSGARVMYRDGEAWREGEIVNTKAVGAAFVRWRMSALSEESENWFVQKDIAPIIHNEAYLAYHHDRLEAGRRGLIPNDMINPRPRTVVNPLLQQSPESRPPISDVPSGSGKQEPWRAMHSSPTYESIASGDMAVGTIDEIPPPLPPSVPGGTADRERNEFVGLDTKLQGREPPPPSDYRRSIEQSSLPCMWSYTSQMGGIPPHQSSRFYKLFQTGNTNRRQLLHRSALDHYHYGNMTQSHSYFGFKTTPPREMPTGTYSDPAIHSRPRLPRKAGGEPSPPRGIGVRSPDRTRRTQNRVGSPRHPRHAPTRKQGGVENRRSRATSNPDHMSSRPPGHPQPYEIPRRTKSDLKSRYSKLLPPQPHRRPPPQPRRLLGEVPATAAATRKTASNEPVNYAEVQFPKPKGPPPTVTSSSPPVVMVNHGGAMMLTCVAQSTTPLQYLWFKDGTRLISDSHKISFLAPEMLHIDNASAGDVGKYSCVVSNEYGSETRTFHVGLTQASSETGAFEKFNSKVTAEEMGVTLPEPEKEDMQQSGDKGEDMDLDSLLDLDPELFSMERKSSNDEIDAKVATTQQVAATGRAGREAGQASQVVTTEKAGGKGGAVPKVVVTEEDAMEVEKDKMQSEPQTVATDERKTLKSNRTRVSSVMDYGVDQYFTAGEHYGVTSSQTDLEKDGLEPFKPIEIARNLDRLDAIRGGKKGGDAAKKKRKAEEEEKQVEKKKEDKKKEDEKKKEEKERQEKEREEKERQEKKRQEKEREEKERQEKKREEKERQEKEREEKKREEKERQEKERQEKERQEKERQEKKREEKEIQEKKREEKERQEKERQEKKREEKERQEKKKEEKKKEEKKRGPSSGKPHPLATALKAPTVATGDEVEAPVNDKPSEDNKPASPVSKEPRKLLKFPKRSVAPQLQKKPKKGFEASNILHHGEEGIQMTARIRGVPEPGQFQLKTFSQEETQQPEGLEGFGSGDEDR